MAKPALIQGVYADLKTIKSRSVVQVVVEVPIERGQEIVEAFGFPQPAAEVHVVIARMANGHQEQAEPSTERRRFHELPVAQQAALACNDPIFRAYLREVVGYEEAQTEPEAAAALRNYFDVVTRRDISTGQWQELYGEYTAWKAAEAA